jgi:hypothetical protein
MRNSRFGEHCFEARAGIAACLCVAAFSAFFSANIHADEDSQLLAEKEKRSGMMTAGQDPAFLLFPRQTERNEIPQTLYSNEIAAMAGKSIAYIVANQNTDGSWSDTAYPRNTGVTALCCLALISEGNMPRVGPHGKALDRGIAFLLKTVQGNGTVAGTGADPLRDGPMYEHALATLALIYAYGNTPWRSEIREVIARSVQLILRTQKPDGGWRYAMTKDSQSDVSVTANVLWVLRASKKCGVTIPAEKVAKGVAFIETCAMPDGHFKYRAFGREAAPSLGGTCIMGLVSNGKLEHPLIAPAREKIAYEYTRYTTRDLQARPYFIYGAFYASLAMYTSGDEYWTTWFRKTASVIKAIQKPGGECPEGEDGNLMYTTAMAAMILQAPRGYLPLYER